MTCDRSVLELDAGTMVCLVLVLNDKLVSSGESKREFVYFDHLKVRVVLVLHWWRTEYEETSKEQKIEMVEGYESRFSVGHVISLLVVVSRSGNKSQLLVVSLLLTVV